MPRIGNGSGLCIALLAASCASSHDDVTTRSTSLAAAPAVRISELHYDNAGTDLGEAIEISGPAGTDVSGWQIVLYNGGNGASYGTTMLAGAIPATCDTRGVLVTTYPSNGIQNGELELARGHDVAAAAMLRVVVLQIYLATRAGIVSAPDAAPLRALLVRVIASIRP